jgi:hypothetical protein
LQNIGAQRTQQKGIQAFCLCATDSRPQKEQLCRRTAHRAPLEHRIRQVTDGIQRLLRRFELNATAAFGLVCVPALATQCSADDTTTVLEAAGGSKPSIVRRTNQVASPSRCPHAPRCQRSESGPEHVKCATRLADTHTQRQKLHCRDGQLHGPEDQGRRGHPNTCTASPDDGEPPTLRSCQLVS